MAAARRSRREWRLLVEQWGRSGQSRSEFARTAGVHPTTLGWWRWKFSTEAPAFHEIVVADHEPMSAEYEPAPDFEVEVGGVVVRVPLGFDSRELRRLVDALC